MEMENWFVFLCRRCALDCSLLHIRCELFCTDVQKTALRRSFFVEHKFNHLADDNQDALWYDDKDVRRSTREEDSNWGYRRAF
jgi:hypothetical protein